MMTEEDAFQCWCPFARDSETAGNRSRSDPTAAANEFPCIGSRCMAWRWSAQRAPVWKDTQEPVKAGTLYRADQVEFWHVGYCGLAGPATSPAPRVPEKEDGR